MDDLDEDDAWTVHDLYTWYLGIFVAFIVLVALFAYLV